MFNSVKEYEKFLKTEEGKEYIKKFTEELEKKIKAQNDLVEKDAYIKWLEEFTEKYPKFSDDTWLYKQDEISKEDYANVTKISTFFGAIQRYAEQNYISSMPCDYGEIYSVKYNGKVYEIGTIVGQGAISFCNTVDVNEKALIITFEDIANPSEKIKTRTAVIKKELGRIDELFKELSKKGIPLDAIIQRTDDVLGALKKDNK